MYLTIRTDKPESEIGLYDKNNNQIDYIKWQAHRELSVTILTKIEEILNQSDKTNQDLKGVIVFKGPGSYTGLRIGITVANAFSYSLNIPIVGKSGGNWIQDGLSSVATKNVGEYVSPEYGGEAHITTPRK